jgi:hypothetical protein
VDEEALAQAARDWLARQLAGVDLAKMFDPVQQVITDDAADLDDALHQLIRLVAVSSVAGLGKTPATAPSEGERRGGHESSAALAGVVGLFTGKLIAAIAPVVTLATVLGQTTSGLSLFTGAVQLVAATLAPILLPGFVLLSAAALALQAVLWDQLKPALGDFYTLIFMSAIPAVRKFIEVIVDAWNEVSRFVKELRGEKLEGKPIPAGFKEEKPEDLEKAFMKVFGPQNLPNVKVGAAAIGGGGMLANIGAEAGAQGGGMPRQPQGGVDRFMKEFMRGIDDTIRQFQFQTGSKASLSGIVGASREAQLKAVGTDPFQQRMLVIVDGCWKALQQAVGALKKPDPPVIV